MTAKGAVRGWRDTLPIKEAEVHFTCVARGEVAVCARRGLCAGTGGYLGGGLLIFRKAV